MKGERRSSRQSVIEKMMRRRKRWQDAKERKEAADEPVSSLRQRGRVAMPDRDQPALSSFLSLPPTLVASHCAANPRILYIICAYMPPRRKEGEREVFTVSECPCNRVPRATLPRGFLFQDSTHAPAEHHARARFIYTSVSVGLKGIRGRLLREKRTLAL